MASIQYSLLIWRSVASGPGDLHTHEKTRLFVLGINSLVV